MLRQLGSDCGRRSSARHISDCMLAVGRSRLDLNASSAGHDLDDQYMAVNDAQGSDVAAIDASTGKL